MAVVQEYFNLTRKYINQFGEKTVLWYQVGSFYEMYANKESDGTFSGCNIQEFSKIGNLTMGKKTTKTVMLGFSTYMIEKYIPCFQDAGYTIVVYDQDANVKNTTRSLKGIISPGTYFSQDCNKVDNNYKDYNQLRPIFALDNTFRIWFWHPVIDRPYYLDKTYLLLLVEYRLRL